MCLLLRLSWSRCKKYKKYHIMSHNVIELQSVKDLFSSWVRWTRSIPGQVSFTFSGSRVRGWSNSWPYMCWDRCEKAEIVDCKDNKSEAKSLLRAFKRPFPASGLQCSWGAWWKPSSTFMAASQEDQRLSKGFWVEARTWSRWVGRQLRQRFRAC